MVWVFVAYAAIAIFAPPAHALAALFGMLGLAAFYVLGTWIVSVIAPQSNLDGPQFVKWHAANASAKGVPAAPDTPVITNPQYRQIDVGSPPSEEGQDER